MAFRRKKKGDGPEDTSSTTDNQVASNSSKRPDKKKRKPDLLLSSVVNESAIGATIDVLKRNETFALPNGTSWVGLLLSVDQIGGLNKKQKGDATKGSIIELIAADKIQVVATAQMLEEEFLGIVPTVETLERMDEYSLLTEAPYFWVVFRSENGGNDLLADAVQDVEATFAQAQAIARGDKSISDLLPHVWAWGGGASEPKLAVSEKSEFDRILHGEPVHASVGAASSQTGGLAAPLLGDDTDPLSDAFDLAGDTEVDYSALAEDVGADLASGEIVDDEPPLEFDAAQFEAQFADAPTGLVHDDEADGIDLSWQNDEPSEAAPVDHAASDDDTGYFQYLAENRDRVVEEQEVRDTIARRFLSNDLELVVDLAEFERVFDTAPEAIALEIASDASDWLGSQIAQLSRQANAELAQIHRDNTDELRQVYVETMALHIETTMSAVSTDNPGSQYSALMDGAKRDFDENRANAAQEIVERRREITEQFEAAAQRRADQAAATARSVYEDKHRPKLDRDLAEVALDHDRRLEEQFAHDRQTVLELRRKDAGVRMDVGTNRIFEHLRSVQAEQREGERALLERWNAQLIQFIDENRKNDIARAMVLADELARQNQVDVLKKEHANQLREARQEARAREEQLQAELTRIRQEALADLERRRADYDASLSVEKERNTTGSAIIGQLREQIDTLGAKFEAQYLDKIATLKAGKKAAEQSAEQAANAHKVTTRLMVLLVTTLTAAGVAVGVIAGYAWSYSMFGQ